MRDLKADLELCNKATPGPWYAGATDDEHFMNLHYVTTEPRSYRHDGERAFVEGLIRRDKVVAITLLQTPRFVDCWQFGENTRFIAEAREGWPHAIERALEIEEELTRCGNTLVELTIALKNDRKRADKAEALARELVEVLEGVQRLKPLIAYPDEVLPEFEEEAMAIANMLNVVDSIVAKAKEVLGDE